MGVQLILGGAGYGKSCRLIDMVIEKSLKQPEKNFIVVVPEQFTMSTQKRLVKAHPRGGILNIDVLSFERLAYRVFDEVGGFDCLTLDDTGKNLILRKVLEENKEELVYFRGSIGRVGFVSELKSVISELLQYDYSPESFLKVGECFEGRAQLRAKIKDIAFIYDKFKEFLNNRYITSEELLDVLSRRVCESKLLMNSELFLDGFTGFTPIQYKLIKELALRCPEITVTITIDDRERSNVLDGMSNVFFMSKEMAFSLRGICDEAHIELKPDIWVLPGERNRFESRELGFLERNLFRSYVNEADRAYVDVCDNISFYNARNSKEELQYVISEILRLTRFEGYRYRDIAIVSGDMSSYGMMAGNICRQNGIPVFIDAKRPVLDNPLIEYIKGALEVIDKDFSYDSVMRYLRSGMTGVAREDIDLLENYLLASGIRGSSMWSKEWRRRCKTDFDLEAVNELRVNIYEPINHLRLLFKGGAATVAEMIEGLYGFMVENESFSRIVAFGQNEDAGREYEQIYGKVCELFDQMHKLLGDQVIATEEFLKVLDSGLAEIKVGLIPPSNDCVLVGDIERTRLEDIKVLFFVGANEGIVPKKNDNRGVLSEAERDALEQAQVKLSPGMRRRAFVQRFYLYLLMTKPSGKLYLSYANKGFDGASALPSYVVKVLREMFPGARVNNASTIGNQLALISIPKASELYGERGYIRNMTPEEAVSLYGEVLRASVSACESFSACQLMYFLGYGLKLREREVRSFDQADFGTVLHSFMENSAKRVTELQLDYSQLDDKQIESIVNEVVDDVYEASGIELPEENTREAHMFSRIRQLAVKSFGQVAKQIALGGYRPVASELSIRQEKVLSDGRTRMQIAGKIDRVDVVREADELYVRVVDYKTGSYEYSLAKTVYGLKMQLLVYLKQAMEHFAKMDRQARVIPGGAFIYSVKEELIEYKEGATDSELERAVAESFRMRGVYNYEESVAEKLAAKGSQKLVYEEGKNSADYSSKAMSEEQLRRLTGYMDERLTSIGDDIMSGKINMNPYKLKEEVACTYCEYKSVCGFAGSKGDRYRVLSEDKEMLRGMIESTCDEDLGVNAEEVK